MSSVVVSDNGGGLCKVAFNGNRYPAIVVPNCLGRSAASKKLLVVNQLLALDADVTSVSVRRPLDHDYLVNPNLQREEWDRIHRSLLHIDPAHSSLILVDPLFNPSNPPTDELIFEDFSFQSLFVADSPSLVRLYGTNRLPHLLQSYCSLIVDCSFSFTYVTHFLQNFTLNYCVRRLNLGGKALTNYLKELISYCSINVMDETLIVDQNPTYLAKLH